MLSTLKPRRCRCARLLFKGIASDIEIKCPRCGAINHFRDTIPDQERRRASKDTANALAEEDPPS